MSLGEGPRRSSSYLRVFDLEALIFPGLPATPAIVLHLEEGLTLTLYHVPLEIVEAINTFRGVEHVFGRLTGPNRESVFDLLAAHEELRRVLTSELSHVVIDELDRETMLFTAKAVFSDGTTTIERRMIPSHAVFLAFIADKPVYVLKRLAEEQAART
ncbi:MAG: hypothetical protein QXU97_02440 [Fervidicoccaceae archaeon]